MVLFTDTNSFMYEIKSEDIYEDCGNNERTFLFSSSSTHSKFYDNSNKLVIGKMIKLLPLQFNNLSD